MSVWEWILIIGGGLVALYVGLWLFINIYVIRKIFKNMDK